MGISVNTSKQQITASVTDESVTATVSAGIGASGAAGTAATITVGTVTTGAPGSSAVVTNAGSSSAAVLNFTIPAGATGATGATGPAGTTTWAGITDKPSTFTPSSHTHTFAESSTTGTYVNFLTTPGGGDLATALSGIDTAVSARPTTSSLSAAGNLSWRGYWSAEGSYETLDVVHYAGQLWLKDGIVDGTPGVDGDWVGLKAISVSHAHSAADVTFAATDRLLGRAASGAGAGEEITCTSAGRALLDDADAAAQRSTLSAQKTITSGTAAPTGGSDGDIYLQYT